jgi:geranylgeranyl pyrophosphate synthase
MVMMLDKQSQKPHDRLAEVLADDMAEVNTLIRTRMASEHAPRIPEVTAHLVEAGGKRLRPMLTLAAARMCGYEGDNHVKLAATVEFIHTATLLHDDVVDESEKRRGRPTANLLWDNKSSVLVGDYLFARSFQLMTETNNIRVLHILSDAAATIAEGEVLQMTAAQDLRTTEDIYLQVVRVIKAVALGDDAERDFWKRTIEKGRQEDGDLEHAIALLNKHGTLEATRAEANDWIVKARTALATLPEHPIREMLDDLADYVVARVN